MKRKTILIIILVLSIEICLIIIYPKNQKDKLITKNEIKDNSISIMLQDENGSYQKSNLNEFNQEGYRFNSKRSKCLSGSKIKYEENNIIVKTTKSDRCYVYFDNNNFVEDLSGNGNHGKNIGAIWQNNSLITGDETDFYGYVDCGLANYNFKSDISLIAKLKFNKYSGNESIFGNWESKGVGIFVRKYYFGFNILGTTRVDITTNTKITDSNWHILVGTYDGNNVSLYIDGNNVKEQAVGYINIEESTSSLNLGADAKVNATGFANKSFATYSEALLFDRALTAEEIAQDYAEQINPTNKQDMLLWYKFN